MTSCNVAAVDTDGVDVGVVVVVGVAANAIFLYLSSHLNSLNLTHFFREIKDVSQVFITLK